MYALSIPSLVETPTPFLLNENSHISIEVVQRNINQTHIEMIVYSNPANRIGSMKVRWLVVDSLFQYMTIEHFFFNMIANYRDPGYFSYTSIPSSYAALPADSVMGLIGGYYIWN